LNKESYLILIENVNSMVSTIAQSENVRDLFVNDLEKSGIKYRSIINVVKCICNTENAFLFIRKGKDTYYFGEDAANIDPYFYKLPVTDQVIHINEIFEIPDFASAALNVQQLNQINGQNIQFFSGVSLVTSENVVIGGLAVADYKPKCLDNSQRNALILIASQLITQAEAIVDNWELKAKLMKLEEELQTMLITASQKSEVSLCIGNSKNEITGTNNTAAERQTGCNLDELKDPSSLELMVRQGTGNSMIGAGGVLENNLIVGLDATERKLAEEQLMAAHEEALRMSAEKENFLAIVSHEMRTPLNAVIGMSRLLAEENPLERQNLMRLINDMLDLTKIDSGKLQLESVPLNLETLIQKTVLSLQLKINEKPIELLYDIDPGIPSKICGDYTRLYQILINLLGNSVKFTHRGYVKLKLSLLKDDDEHITIFFEVSDTGIGVAPEKIDLIFGAFSQAGTDTSRKYGGTGLGLAITKRLIQLYDSEIKVTSTVGRGSTFSFPITFKKNLLPENPLPTEVKKQVRIDGRVLLVEDNAINRLLAKNILKKWNLQVDVAENGLEALNKVIENEYDLVLMDIHMPVMGGIESVQSIRSRKDQKYQLLPIIALTADALPGDEHKFKALGMNDYIAKPFDPIVFRLAGSFV
jgi:signal transduction histidine kinase